MCSTTYNRFAPAVLCERPPQQSQTSEAEEERDNRGRPGAGRIGGWAGLVCRSPHPAQPRRRPSSCEASRRHSAARK